MNAPITSGAHHIGLTVSNLQESAEFFTSLLGWKEVRRNGEYPAIYVSDGAIMLLLWAAKKELPLPCDRRGNIGLHHLAFRVENESKMHTLCDRHYKCRGKNRVRA